MKFMRFKKIDLRTIKGFIIGIIFTLTITMGITGVVFATNGTFEGMKIVYVTVDNKIVEGDVPAVILNGRTMVPLKFVSEALGATVTWDETTGTANVKTTSTELVSPTYTEPSYQTDDFIKSKIWSDFDGFDSGNIYELMNGQYWKQTSYQYKYSYKFMPEVIIYKDGLNYKMIVEGIDTEITVERIK